MSWHPGGEPHSVGQHDPDGDPRRQRPGPAVSVPTLTEVIGLGDAVESGPDQHSGPALSPEAPPGPADTALEAAMRRIQPEIERLFEQRLREALDPALSRAIGPLVASAVQAAVDAAVEQAVAQTRAELVRLLHQRVADAMAQDMLRSV